MNQELSDEVLARAAQDGDARAFETLLGRHDARVLRVLGLLGVPREERDDVAQEVFIRVFRHLPGFRTRLSFGAWIYRVTVNAAHDYRGRAGRRSRDESPWTEAVGETLESEAETPLEAALSRDLQRQLEAALGHLAERERAVFVLRELEGLDSAEIARTLGISRITVRRHLGRARRSLARLLEDPAAAEKNDRGVERPGLDAGSYQRGR